MSQHEEIGKSNEWYTPKYVFDALGVHFDCDVACPWDKSHIHVPCDYHITAKSLEHEWEGFIWMNPPFGGRNGLEPWLNKFILHGNGIALTPDRSSAPWWQNTAKKCDAHMQVDGKIKFIDEFGKTGDSPSNGTTLWACGEKGVKALITAENNGLGLTFARLRSYQYKLV